jgi:hypothetical protein
VPVILLTGFAEFSGVTVSRQTRVLRKPVSSGDLLTAMEAAIGEAASNVVAIRPRSA